MNELFLLEIFFVLSVVVFLIAVVVILPTMIFDRVFYKKNTEESISEESKHIAHL